MDVRKILQNINLILDIENKHQMQNLFQEVLSFYQSRDPDNLRTRKESISQAIEDSEIGNFVHSDLNILEGIGIRGYFDIDSVKRLENILESPGYEAENQLIEFINKRAELVNKIRQLQSSLEVLEVEEEQRETYQIVLSLPEQYQDLNKLEKLLKDIRFLLQELNSKDKDSKPFKIASVNNGSIEFFIGVGPELVGWFSDIVGGILKVCGLIQAYEKGKTYYKDYAKKRKEEADKIAQEHLEEKKKQIIDELIKQLPVKTPEERTRIKRFIVNMVKHLENGVYAEIKTPKIEEPDEISDEDDDNTKKQKREILKQVKVKKAIDDKNKQLFLAQREGMYLQLPNPEENNED